jgi:bacterioferritin-associated ferredoxin
MIICVCQNVSERDIAQAVAKGCHSFSALQEELEVGKCCGTCVCAARETFAEQKAGCGSRKAA